jgi:hypothetical protein
MQRANSSEPIVDFVYGSTYLPSDGEKRWKAARLYEAPSSITFLFFEKMDSQSNCDAKPAFISLLDSSHSA